MLQELFVSRDEPLRIIEGRQFYRVGAATLSLKVVAVVALPEQDTIAVVETGGNKVIDDGFCHGYDTQLVGRIIFESQFSIPLNKLHDQIMMICHLSGSVLRRHVSWRRFVGQCISAALQFYIIMLFLSHIYLYQNIAASLLDIAITHIGIIFR